MNEGWKCPECGKCYAPWVSECRNETCGVVISGGITNTPIPSCKHEWASDTSGTFCIKCGARSSGHYLPTTNTTVNGTNIDNFEPWY